MSDSGEANLNYLFNAVDEIVSIAKSINFNSIILTTKSTVPVGTGNRIKEIISKENLTEKIQVASNPNF